MKNFNYRVYDRMTKVYKKFSVNSDNELEALLECVKLAGRWIFDPDTGGLFFDPDTGKWMVDPDAGFYPDLLDYLNDLKISKLHASTLTEIKAQINKDYGWVITTLRSSGKPRYRKFIGVANLGCSL